MANNFNYNLRGVQFELHLKDKTKRYYYFNVIDLPIESTPQEGFYPFGPITTKPNDTALFAAYTGADAFPVPVEGDPVATTTFIVGLYTAQDVFNDGSFPTAIHVTSTDGSIVYVSGNPNSRRPPVINLGALQNLESTTRVLQSDTNVSVAPYETMIDYFFVLFTHADSGVPNQFTNLNVTTISMSDPHPLGSMFLSGTFGSNAKTHPVCVCSVMGFSPTNSVGSPYPPDPSMGIFPAYGIANSDGIYGPMTPIDYNDIYHL